jgi:hypothetical protein
VLLKAVLLGRLTSSMRFLFGPSLLWPNLFTSHILTRFMQNDQTECSRNQNGRELRAAVDVMFEALSHIQASINASEPEAREKQYQTFKEALYERFDHLLEQRYSDAASGDPTTSGDAASEDARAAEEDTPSGERFGRPPQEVSGDGAADPALLDAMEPHLETSSASEEDTANGGGAANGDALERTEEPAGHDEEASTLWPE